MKIIRNEQNPDMIMEIIFAENEDPVKCLDLFEKIEKNRLDAVAKSEETKADVDKARIDADKAKCEMSHETNRHNMTMNTEIAAMQADTFKHQISMNALMPMLDANMKAINPTEIANKLIDDEFKDIELTATDEDNITDKVRR